jgi:simple sugar transport system permease protein
MMITGAVCGFNITVNTGSPAMGFVMAAVGGAVLSLLFAFLTQVALANQVASGLALTLFGLGISALLGQSYVGIKPPKMGDVNFGPLTDIPVIGPIVFGHDPIVYVGLIIVAGVWAVLKYTRAGLVLRAVGENHDAAHALGYKVKRIRTLAIMFGGACAGLGGAYISLIRVPQWTEGMTAGVGWIALALVVFASWKPGRLLLGAYLFGGITQLQLNLQGANASLLDVLMYVLPMLAVVGGVIALASLARGAQKKSRGWGTGALALLGITGLIMLLDITGLRTWVNEAFLLSSSPYIMTIIVLVILSRDKGGAPASLGRIFHASS